MTGLSRVEHAQVLVVVAELDEVAALHAARVGLLLAEQDAQQRRLAAAVRPHDAEPLAARQVEAQVLEQRLVVRSCDRSSTCEHDVAGAPHLAEVHVRRLDLRRPLEALDLVELLLPRRGLLVQLAVVDAADVLLLLLDVLLLRLVRLQLPARTAPAAAASTA